MASAAASVGNDRAQLRALSQLTRLEPSNREWLKKLTQLRGESGAAADEPSRAPEANSAPSATSAAAPSAKPAGGAGTYSPEGWRDSLTEAQELEVYSKSAGKWIPSRVVQLSADMVKLKYLIDGHWCEKVLLRNSEMLRPRQPGDEPDPDPSEASAASNASAIAAAAAAKAAASASLAEAAAAIKREAAAAAAATAAAAAAADAAASASRRRSQPEIALPNTGSGHRIAATPPIFSASSSPAGTVHQPETSPPKARVWSDPTPARQPEPAAVKKPAPEPVNKKLVEPIVNKKPDPEPIGKKPEPVNNKTPDLVIGKKPKPHPTSHPELLEPSELIFGAVLGSGGFGAVYKGSYRGEEVAIKKLHPMDGQISAAQMDEFKKEVANLQALRHTRLVSFIGAAFVRPSLCLVLEFMSNGSLYDLLHQRRTPLTTEQRFGMAVQVSEGVNFLHSLSPPFVHRDLKSLNVVLDMALNCKLCDFGLTQTMDNTHISRKDNEGGSPRYMAPELFDSKGRITEKVDVWALGCLAVEIFTGRVPHEECNTIQQVMIKTLVNKQLPFLDWNGVHPEIRKLAEACFIFDTRVRMDAPTFVDGLIALRGRV